MCLDDILVFNWVTAASWAEYRADNRVMAVHGLHLVFGLFLIQCHNLLYLNHPFSHIHSLMVAQLPYKKVLPHPPTNISFSLFSAFKTRICTTATGQWSRRRTFPPTNPIMSRAQLSFRLFTPFLTDTVTALHSILLYSILCPTWHCYCSTAAKMAWLHLWHVLMLHIQSVIETWDSVPCWRTLWHTVTHQTQPKPPERHSHLTPVMCEAEHMFSFQKHIKWIILIPTYYTQQSNTVFSPRHIPQHV